MIWEIIWVCFRSSKSGAMWWGPPTSPRCLRNLLYGREREAWDIWSCVFEGSSTRLETCWYKYRDQPFKSLDPYLRSRDTLFPDLPAQKFSPMALHSSCSDVGHRLVGERRMDHWWESIPASRTLITHLRGGADGNAPSLLWFMEAHWLYYYLQPPVRDELLVVWRSRFMSSSLFI